ncbi:hypothetical protein BDV95DRAFT_598202 [Massariosphaeria phaeospora]|uniref:Uncharacterized protein n=1 Tax=Massariosphaeria phaeospora TaxID=100035 RepID=A0A7C8M2W7_9PLEO|nr:hypothetical protein BDV95DRAFT_598202 [Massariosphaeria phaeospora]
MDRVESIEHRRGLPCPGRGVAEQNVENGGAPRSRTTGRNQHANWHLKWQTYRGQSLQWAKCPGRRQMHQKRPGENCAPRPHRMMPKHRHGSSGGGLVARGSGLARRHNMEELGRISDVRAVVGHGERNETRCAHDWSSTGQAAGLGCHRRQRRLPEFQERRTIPEKV